MMAFKVFVHYQKDNNPKKKTQLSTLAKTLLVKLIYKIKTKNWTKNTFANIFHTKSSFIRNFYKIVSIQRDVFNSRHSFKDI